MISRIPSGIPSTQEAPPPPPKAFFRDFPAANRIRKMDRI